MNKGYERRLKKLEDKYAARLCSHRVIGIKFLTAEDLSRGLGPGLHDEDLSRSDAIDGSAVSANPRSSPPGIEGLELPPG